MIFALNKLNPKGTLYERVILDAVKIVYSGPQISNILYAISRSRIVCEEERIIAKNLFLSRQILSQSPQLFSSVIESGVILNVNPNWQILIDKLSVTVPKDSRLDVESLASLAQVGQANPEIVTSLLGRINKLNEDDVMLAMYSLVYGKVRLDISGFVDRYTDGVKNLQVFTNCMHPILPKMMSKFPFLFYQPADVNITTQPLKYVPPEPVNDLTFKP